jgi:hypothetical protein
VNLRRCLHAGDVACFRRAGHSDEELVKLTKKNTVKRIVTVAAFLLLSVSSLYAANTLLMALRCSSRLFSAMMPSSPKKVHLRNRFSASLLLVLPWMVDRGILFQRVPSSLSGFRIWLRQKAVVCGLAVVTDRIGDTPVQATVHLRPATLRFLMRRRKARQLNAAPDQLLDGDVNDIGQIFHPRSRQPYRWRKRETTDRPVILLS